MLLTLLYWFYVALLATVTGFVLVLKAMRCTSQPLDAAWKVSLPFYTFGGLAFYGALANLISLFSPLSAWVNGLPLLLSLLAALAEPAALREGWRRIRADLPQWRWPAWLLLGLSTGAALYLSALPSQIIDDGHYYQQYLRWMKEHAVVPGLAHLNARFGFNSSWHSLEAFFNGAYFWGFRTELTGLLQVLLAIHAAQCLRAIRKGRAHLSHYVALGALPLTALLSKMMTAPAMDAALALYAVALLLLYLERWRQAAWGLWHPLNVLLLGSTLFALTIKLSSLALAGFAIALLVESSAPAPGKKAWLALAALATAVFIPWLLRFYFLTGYLVFPLHELDLFLVDWKLPSALVAEERMYIRGFARVKQLPYPEALQLSLGEWLPRWFQEHWGTGRLILLGGAGSLVSLLSILLFRRATGRQNTGTQPLTVPTLVALAGLIYWLGTAPALRFGFAYFFLPLGLMAALLLRYLVDIRLGARSSLVAVSAVVIGAFMFQRAVNEAQSAQNNTLLPPWIWPAVPQAKVQEHSPPKSDFSIKLPQEGPCWDAALPCVPFLPEGVQRRGSSLGRGFYNPQIKRRQYRRRLLENF